METILVQETDADTLEVLTVALHMEGCQVYSLTDTNDNLPELIRRHRPKLVLLDSWLGHDTGQQLSQRIKAHFPRMPVIAFSCDNNIDAEYRQLGFDGYLKKPFDLEVLYRLIGQYGLQESERRISETA